ncbi:MAG: purine-nucleoside phosphorylase [Polyangia bacterium]
MVNELQAAVAAIRGAIPHMKPRLGVILGSGLGAWADRLTNSTAVAYDRIPGIPTSTVVGHAGRLVYGMSGDVPVVALQGRVHTYEGHDLARAAFPARVLCALGCDALIVTNAAGGIDATLTPGQIVVISDHLNLLGGSPLRGHNDDAIGPRFPDMTGAYSPRLRKIALAAGAKVGMKLREGIYAALPGPQYETPAEVRMIRGLGADLVGMSTVPEVIVARHMGKEVLGLSCVTNLAAGVTGEALSHSEVTETANAVSAQFMALLDAIVKDA